MKSPRRKGHLTGLPTAVPEPPVGGDSDTFAALMSPLAGTTDPLEAEYIVASLLAAITATAGDEAAQAWHEFFVPTIEDIGTGEAAAMLSILAELGGSEVSADASAAASRLTTAGVMPPPWAPELTEPWHVRDCCALHNAGDDFVLAARCDRAGASEALVLLLEPDDCGAVAEIMHLPGAELPDVLDQIRALSEADGMTLRSEPLDTAEFRWAAEVALDARDVHDQDDGPLDPDDWLSADDPDEIDDYPVSAVLTRARIRKLPLSDKPKPPHTDELSSADLAAMFTLLEQQAAEPRTRGLGAPQRQPAKLPPKRKTRDGTAPILRLRVDIRHAKPPIWRRLEVPGDITLAALHEVVQIAFGWSDSHLHVFETAYGDFGTPDPSLGHRSENKVTLEQVASIRDKLTYRYDFGDDWEHVIALESATADTDARVPQCTGGRRAAPPEDCGGIGGYEYLAEVLADPNHPEHRDRLEWLGLDSGADFDPAAFDKERVNRLLAKRR